MRRVLKFLRWLIIFAIIGGAVAVAFIDMPAPTRQIETPVDLGSIRQG